MVPVNELLTPVFTMIVHELRQVFEQALKAAFGHDVQPDVTPATQVQFGHYQCNNSLKIGKELKIAPRDAAARIVAAMPKVEWIDRLEIAGPGFINIFLNSRFLAQKTMHLLSDSRLGIQLPKKPQKIIVEFSSPNVAKELHVGHLRSTIIGDSLARLFEFLGHQVIRLNHIGDWGTQFGMLIAYMKLEKKSADVDLSQLMAWYRASKQLFDADPTFKKQAQLEVVRLQGGDPDSLKMWQAICVVSRKAFDEIYQLLDVRLQERGESFYNPFLPKIIEDLEKKGLITVSDGAKCIFLEGFSARDGASLPMIVQKADGGYNYDTTDMAAMRHRIQEEKAERIIVVTDAGQSLHFEMLYQAAVKAGYFQNQSVQFDHVPFGVVLGGDGKKFKTRSGDTEKLVDLLLEAVTRAKVILQERLPDLAEPELSRTAEILGIDALKYADLSCHRIKDYHFSYDRMLKFEGNTAAFLLYAYVRIQGIKRKVGKELSDACQITIEHPTEVILSLHLCQFEETLDHMARDLLPNRLCDYLYGLAEKFHAFFRDCRVEGDVYEESRLLLCEATGRVLAQGLSILGLKTLNRM